MCSDGEWVYCFTNNEGHYRIGKSINVDRRLAQLKRDGPYSLCFAKKVTNAKTKVKIICNLLSKYKNDNNLYNIPNINSIKLMFDLMEGEWYNEYFITNTKKEGVCNEKMIRKYLEDNNDNIKNFTGSKI